MSEDKRLICKICGAEFVFTTGEQQFYHDRVLPEPKRCINCRMKTRREELLKVKEESNGENRLSQKAQ